jgi:hypothetical protein
VKKKANSKSEAAAIPQNTWKYLAIGFLIVF